jgi:hypothetical protein
MARVDHARAVFTVRCAIYTRKSSDEGLAGRWRRPALKRHLEDRRRPGHAQADFGQADG